MHAPVLPKDATIFNSIICKRQRILKPRWPKKIGSRRQSVKQLVVTCCNKNQSSRANDCRLKSRKCQTKWEIPFFFRLFSVIRSFIFVCSFFFFYSLFLVCFQIPCETFVVRLSSFIGLRFTKMWSRFIYHLVHSVRFGHNARSHILEHMWTFLFKTSHLYFLRLFLVLHLDNKTENCCTIFSSWTKDISSATKEQISSWNALIKGSGVCASLKRDNQTNVLLLEPVKIVFTFTILQFTLRYLSENSNERKSREKTHVVFRLNWSIECNKVTAIANDQCKQTIKWNCFVPKLPQTMWNINASWTWKRKK